MIRELLRAARLVLLVERGVLHILLTPKNAMVRVGRMAFCRPCRAYMFIHPDGQVSIDHDTKGRRCPTHVAIQEVTRVDKVAKARVTAWASKAGR